MSKSTVVLCLLCLLLLAVSVFAGSRSTDPLGIAVSPQTLILNSDQGTVCVHTDIPLSKVNTSTLALSGVPVRSVKADARGCLVAYFDEAAVKAIVAPPQAVLTLTGSLKDGTAFSGSDTVQVIYK